MKHLALIIAAITSALAGLIALQVYLLFVSYEQKEQAFDRNVMIALNAVAQQLEKEEAASKIFTVAMQTPPGAAKKLMRFARKDSLAKPLTKKFSWIITDTVKNRTDGQMRVEVFHSSGIDTLTTIMVQGGRGKTTRTQSIGYSYSTDESGVRIKTQFGDTAMVLLQDTTKKRRGEIVSKVVDRLFLLETLPLEKRVDLTTLDSLIKRSLTAVGIDMGYHYRIDVEADDSLRLMNTRGDGTTIASTGYKTRLFPNDVISEKYDLVLFLHDRSAFVLNDMLLLLVLSLFFMTIITASFVYSIRTIIRQKRFAVSIMDFINNMTHEFKTPISTIALAAEAIARPETLKSKTKLLQYNRVIADENVRMKKQVDTILHMAVLEEGEFELKRLPVDMHHIIDLAVKNLSLQIDQRQGSITVACHAQQSTVEGDSVHLTNIIHNVLDNAIKYSSSVPTIAVSTANRGGMISLTVRDAGLGIDKEHLARVFDKYFRVPTGNKHDVKGFGLGLSYVKLMVEAHGGTVSISSEPGKGTTVEIALPVTLRS